MTVKTNPQQNIKFGQIALSHNMVDSKTLTYCMQLLKTSTGKNLSDIMLEHGFLNHQQVSHIKSKVAQSALPSQIGRYKILNEIGRGGMGIIYKVQDTLGGRIVAMKVLIRSSQENNMRFLREAKATARLRHPNIVTLYDIGQDQDKYFFTMDFIEGVPLDEFIKSDATISVRKIAVLMTKICAAIHFAHQHGIIHRDIKPANIMMDANENPKVMDFGLAKLQDASQKLSVSGTMIGTIYYMPPEQVEGRIASIDERSDVYSLGALLYTLLTNRPPFSGHTITQVSKQILEKDPVPPSNIKQIVPKSLDAICLKALAKKQDMRYQSTEDMCNDLEKFLRGEKISKDKGQQQRKIKKWLAKNLILLGIFAITLAVVVTLFSSSYNNLYKQYQKLSSQRLSTPDALFIKAFHYFLDTQREHGQALIDSICTPDAPPRYHLLKVLYDREHQAQDPLKKQVNKYFSLTDDNNKYVCYIKGRLYSYKLISHENRVAQALAWYKKGAEQNFAPCIESMGTIYFYEPSFKDDKRAFALFQKASPEYHWATYFLANMYLQGIAVKKDPQKALQLHRNAAQRGNLSSMCLMGDHHVQAGNIKQAIEWYQKAIEHNDHTLAYFNLGKIYLEREDYHDTVQGTFLILRACTGNIPGARLYLAKWYMSKKSYHLSRKLLYRSQQAEAFYLLGEIFRNGWGIKSDKKKARQLYRKAAKLNFAKAQQRLDKIKD
ncbi:serine/threonine-protein kinase [Candidatus Uabimicrobium amorphum]|uniref:non-specific serine/threonine protein kinase n=1 Tax=Uabimicrobium amorphum TaxID=2596890 RepID=A0A5S9IKU6_UABAM|nr:serine/threonine-protein kinase [Candidatus Uabimicrobium amorphum]BBM83723.1 protein kinase [Candidatus Uabimicrobium amorphum]